VVDAKTAKFNLKAPTAPFVDSLDLVAIVPKHLMEKDPKDFHLHPVGSGPFKLKEFVQGDRVVLDANPDYFAGRPAIDQLTFRNIPDASTRAAELESGGADLVLPVLGTQVGQLDGQRGVHIQDANAATYREIGLNSARPPFDNKLVRQALSYAIDRQAIVSTVWPGFTPAVGPITPNSFAFDQNATGYTYDPQKAKNLLSQAGFPNGVDFQYTISTREGEDREAALIQQQAAAAGFRVSISKMDFSALIQKVTLQNDFDAARIGVSQTADPDTQLYLWYHSSNIGNGGLNFGAYRNADVDKLLDGGRTNIDQTHRTEDYQQAQKILLDDAPAVWMYYEKWIYGVGPKVQNFRPHPSGYFAIKTPFGGNVSTTAR
jgi:peptide/nickel transport system substrate-binding protein